jgi:hypothetical protein
MMTTQMRRFISIGTSKTVFLLFFLLLIDRQATEANVLHSLNELFTVTRPEDIVIFFTNGKK